MLASRAMVALAATLAIVISKSGETADTLAALKHAQALGHARTLGICNVATGSMLRQTALGYLMTLRAVRPAGSSATIRRAGARATPPRC